jgi:DNA-binding NarL/FixJ family response regulator
MNILIVDDHPLMLSSIQQLAQEQFPTSEITTAKTVLDAEEQLQNLMICWKLAIVDLSIPQNKKDSGRSETGIIFLRDLMKRYPQLNLMVCSSNIKALVQLKHQIDNHQGGFTIADKMLPVQEIQRRMQYAVDGLALTKEVRKGLELKSEWLHTLQLAAEGLQDKGISEKLNVTERAVRHYWTKLQDVLEIYVEGTDKINLRVLTLKRAREEGLIN